MLGGKRYPCAVNPDEKQRTRTAFTSGGLVREVSYLHEGEVYALVARAKKGASFQG
jgi:hypothetical protein